MFRLQGHIIPEEKSIWIWLTKVYWIWLQRSKSLLLKLWVDFKIKTKDLTDEQQKLITNELKNYLLESDLKREISTSIKRLKEIKCYRWSRHTMWLPVRWQKTNKNWSTAKKLLWRSKVRPVLKK